MVRAGIFFYSPKKFHVAARRFFNTSSPGNVRPRSYHFLLGQSPAKDFLLPGEDYLRGKSLELPQLWGCRLGALDFFGGNRRTRKDTAAKGGLVTSFPEKRTLLFDGRLLHRELFTRWEPESPLQDNLPPLMLLVASRSRFTLWLALAGHHLSEGRGYPAYPRLLPLFSVFALAAGLAGVYQDAVDGGPTAPAGDARRTFLGEKEQCLRILVDNLCHRRRKELARAPWPLVDPDSGEIEELREVLLGEGLFLLRTLLFYMPREHPEVPGDCRGVSPGSGGEEAFVGEYLAGAEDRRLGIFAGGKTTPQNWMDWEWRLPPGGLDSSFSAVNVSPPPFSLPYLAGFYGTFPADPASPSP